MVHQEYLGRSQTGSDTVWPRPGAGLAASLDLPRRIWARGRVAFPGALRVLRPNAVLLFRYPALTGNAHRIHYDLDYATREEGYPGLVVHGPLQATPAGHALVDERLLTLLALRGEGTVRVETRDADGAGCMEGEATLG
jgi:hydroxyacyl-ACP dehydratase HTD2-like protein with hotdog domain